MNKKITLLTTEFPPNSGGIAQHLYEIVCNIPDNQVNVIALPTPGYKEFDDQQEFKIHRLPIPPSWSPFQRQLKFLAPLYFWQLFTQKSTDVVLCGLAHYVLMFVAWLNYRITNRPFGVFVYGLDLLYPQRRRYKRFFNYLLCNARIIFADSRAAANIAINLGAKSENVFVINPPANPAKLNLSGPSKLIREKYKLSDKKIVLTVGRLVERKGFDTVIRVLPQIKQIHPDIHYLIVGSGPQEKDLRKLVQDLKLEDHVTFNGYVPDDELGAYYSACDVFVMISRDILEKGDIEGFGIVYLEANLMGKPVIAGRSGGVEDAVIHERTGLLVDPNEPQEIVNAFVRLLNDPELTVRLGQFGKRRAETEFSSSVITRKVLKLLEFMD